MKNASYHFAPASEEELIVFGAARPGYQDEQVQDWIEFMQQQQIQQVCCLLPPKQLLPYSGLIATYQQAFGMEQVCWAPIEDFQVAEPKILIEQILPFLRVADKRQEKVVVHCAGGIGRTRQVLAAWLVSSGAFPIKRRSPL
jgi:protein-tyrosine phosphatase